jgi:hypothetical protein
MVKNPMSHGEERSHEPAHLPGPHSKSRPSTYAEEQYQPRSIGKWFEINRLTATHSAGIFAIQEIHVADELETSFRHLFSRELEPYHSPSPTSLKAVGMAIVLNKAIARTNGATHHPLIEGGAILAEIPWQANSTLRILVVYAPNNPRDSQLF